MFSAKMNFTQGEIGGDLKSTARVITSHISYDNVPDSPNPNKTGKNCLFIPCLYHNKVTPSNTGLNIHLITNVVAPDGVSSI